MWLKEPTGDGSGELSGRSHKQIFEIALLVICAVLVAALKNDPIVSQDAEGNKSDTLYLILDKKSGEGLLQIAPDHS